jgi:hypothetical protein
LLHETILALKSSGQPGSPALGDNNWLGQEFTNQTTDRFSISPSRCFGLGGFDDCAHVFFARGSHFLDDAADQRFQIFR